MWDYDRLARKWDTHHTQALCTDYNQSLAATIELSLVSGPLYPNTPRALFCTFPRPASPTSSTYPVGCLSSTLVELIELTMSATTEVLHLVR